MKEIGGYIQLDKYTLPMLHESAIKLNCGRNALAYLLRVKKIKKIQIPKFLCASVGEVCKRENVEIKYYSISTDFMPRDVSLEDDEWLYLVNFYGQLDNEKIQQFANEYKHLIVDNAQAYFQMPVDGVDTLYTCRKYFGVADGAFLYTDSEFGEELAQDESFDRMRFLLGRFERTASDFYSEYVENNHLFADEEIKRMSKLTENLLHGIDYEKVKQCRTENFKVLHREFKRMNQLNLVIPNGAFMYPLYIENGAKIRKQLQAKKIYIPTLWPDVFNCCKDSETEYDLAKNILPIPVDQRYGIEDMYYIIDEVKSKYVHKK